MKSLFVSEHASCMHLHSHQFPVYMFTAYIIPSMFSRNNFMTTNNIRYGNGNDSNEILSTNFFSKFLQILDFRKLLRGQDIVVPLIGGLSVSTWLIMIYDRYVVCRFIIIYLVIYCLGTSLKSIQLFFSLGLTILL